jgi:hypothetical protein
MKKIIALVLCLACVVSLAYAVQGGNATKKTTGASGTQVLLSRPQSSDYYALESYTWPIFKGVTDAGAVSDTFNFIEADNIWAAGYARDLQLNIVTTKATSSPTDSGAIDLWIWCGGDSLVWYQPMRYAPMGTDTATLFTDCGLAAARAKITHIVSSATISVNLGDFLGPNFFAKRWKFIATSSATAAAFGANDSTKVSLTVTKLKRN